MGNCHSFDKVKDAVKSARKREPICLCDSALVDEVVPVPYLSHEKFNAINIDWDTLGQLIPYDHDVATDSPTGTNAEGHVDISSLRRQLSNNKPRPYFTKAGEGDVASSLARKASANEETPSISQFKETLHMWSKFKIGSNALKKLHGVTDAWCYLDKEHVPLPQHLFRSREGSFAGSLDGRLSVSSKDASRLSTERSQGRSSARLSRCGSSASGLVKQATADMSDARLIVTSATSANNLTTTSYNHTSDVGKSDWLNYELVFRPYLNENKSGHKYTCLVRPRSEPSPRDKKYNIDEDLVQLLGEILDPFQLQSNNENRMRVIAKIKKLLQAESTGTDYPVPPTASIESQNEQKTVNRKVKSEGKRGTDLRHLSTISDQNAFCVIAGANVKDCTAPLGLDLDNALCYNMEPMDPQKPCQPKFKHRQKRKDRFGDMSDIPLLS